MLLSQENTIAEAAKQIGVTEQAYYRFRKQYGGMTETDAKKLKELEFELATNYSRYGYPRITTILRKDYLINHKRESAQSRATK